MYFAWDHKDCFTTVYQSNNFYEYFIFISLHCNHHTWHHLHKIIDPCSPAHAECTRVITVHSKFSVREGYRYIFGYKKNDSWAVYSCFTAALFSFLLFLGCSLLWRVKCFFVGKNSLGLSFTNLRTSTRSSGEATSVHPPMSDSDRWKSQRQYSTTAQGTECVLVFNLKNTQCGRQELLLRPWHTVWNNINKIRK